MIQDVADQLTWPSSNTQFCYLVRTLFNLVQSILIFIYDMVLLHSAIWIPHLLLGHIKVSAADSKQWKKYELRNMNYKIWITIHRSSMIFSRRSYSTIICYFMCPTKQLNLVRYWKAFKNCEFCSQNSDSKVSYI